MRLSETRLAVITDADFDDLGLLPNGRGTLGYLSDVRFLSKVGGPVITSVYDGPGYPLGAAWAQHPEDEFWGLHERLILLGFYPKCDTEVGEGTTVHHTAVIGKEGFEIHNGRLIPHAGYVRIGDRVTIGAQTCVDRSLWKQPTSIGDDTHLDNLVHCAHNVQIGKRCMIVAGSVIGGSAVIGDDVFIGIGARIRPGVHIGNGAFIGMSVNVLRDVAPGERLVISRND